MGYRYKCERKTIKSLLKYRVIFMTLGVNKAFLKRRSKALRIKENFIKLAFTVIENPHQKIPLTQ